jgi:SH3 domain protein
MKPLWRWIIAVMIAVSGFCPLARAETAYIVDIIKVALRSAPGNDHKSVATTESGQAVEVLKSGEEWSLVRLGNGAEGYLLTRLLTTNPPARYRFEQLQEKNKTLSGQAAALMEENNRLKAEIEKLAAVVSTGEKEVAALQGEFEAFRKEAADVTALKSRADALAAELEQKKTELARWESGPLAIMDNENLQWFLAGAVVLLAGFFTGYVTKRQRRWSSLN